MYLLITFTSQKQSLGFDGSEVSGLQQNLHFFCKSGFYEALSRTLTCDKCIFSIEAISEGEQFSHRDIGQDR